MSGRTTDLGADLPVVLVLGDDGSAAPIRYAVEHARRTGRELHLVLGSPVGPRKDNSEGLRLGSALRLAEDRGRGEVVTTASYCSGPDVLSHLLTAAARAETLILGRTGPGHSGGLVDEALPALLAARSGAPVHVVPPAWRPRRGDPLVVVGVQDAVEAASLLDVAATSAEELGARVLVVHAWWAGVDDDFVVAGDARERAFVRTAHASLDPSLREVRSRRPGLRVDLQVLHGRPAAVLTRAGEQADLVVAGRRHHRLPFGSHLGPVARALLDRCPTPVLLITPATSQEASASA